MLLIPLGADKPGLAFRHGRRPSHRTLRAAGLPGLWLGVAAGLCAAGTAGESISCGTYRHVHSDILQEERTVLIGLPGDYATGEKRYPVLYKLDGGKSVFLQTVGTVAYLADWRLTPDHIVVGIESPDRNRDMVPERGADDFVRFLKEELVPWIEREYRVDGHRVLAGQSLSSVFAVHALLREPALFDGYVLSSFGLSVQSLQQFERALGELRSNAWRTARVFVANARSDTYDPDGARTRRGAAFLEALQTASRAKVTVASREFDDQGHVPFPTTHYALRWIHQPGSPPSNPP